MHSLGGRALQTEGARPQGGGKFGAFGEQRRHCAGSSLLELRWERGSGRERSLPGRQTTGGTLDFVVKWEVMVDSERESVFKRLGLVWEE